MAKGSRLTGVAERHIPALTGGSNARDVAAALGVSAPVTGTGRSGETRRRTAAAALPSSEPTSTVGLLISGPQARPIRRASAWQFGELRNGLPDYLILSNRC